MKTDIKQITLLIKKDPGQYSVMTDPLPAVDRTRSGEGSVEQGPLGSCYFEIFVKTKSQTNRLQ